MAARSLSPGGALLRASKVFAIPPPLPHPQNNLSSTAIFNSDSATLPHPIHLTITTTQSSLSRGDWGFKRPFPLRSTTKTSTPLMRVKEIDTWEHVTEFGSAADHTLTLQKWQEMGLPLSTPAKQNHTSNLTYEPRASGKSVFEDSIDTIATANEEVGGRDDVRWKFSGPWLAGLTEGNFDTYVLNEVRRRKDDFRQFLRTACATETTQAQLQRATEHGEEIPPIVEGSNVTEEQLTDYIKALRRDKAKLNRHIRSFLDLPPPPNIKLADAYLSVINDVFDSFAGEAPSISDSPYADSGPPKTHPSAGLAYSRTASHTFNHPVYGPQKNKPPVQARVIMPKGAATGNFPPILGVGGIAVNVPASEASFNTSRSKGPQNRPQNSGLFNVDPDAEGGSKLWVQPKHAQIDTKGRIILTVGMADPEAVAVKEGRVGDIPKEDYRPRPFKLMNGGGAGLHGGGYGVTRGNSSRRTEDRRMVKADNDAVQELVGLVDRQERKTQ